MKRVTNPSILIIMEGENSEPNFFGALLGGTSQLPDGSVVSLWPEPRRRSQQPAPSKRVPGIPKASAGGPFEVPSPSGMPGIPPVKWILAAKSKIASKAFSEAWAVFDHDNHPALKEGFTIADEDPKVNLAFSSRSFEYFMLLHFEKIYYPFQETQCKAGLACGLFPASPPHGDCNGQLCINGYARSKQYWIESKRGEIDQNPIWKQMITRLELGIYNSNWLRRESERQHPQLPIWERNPYVTTDGLVKRLTGIWLTIGVPHRLKEGLEITLSAEGIVDMRNTHAAQMLILRQGMIKQYNLEGDFLEAIGDRMVLGPSETQSISLNQYFQTPCYFVFEEWGNAIKFILG